MRDSELRNRLKRALDETPIDLLEDLVNTPVGKMVEHDEITEQFPRARTLPKKETKKTIPIFRYMAIAASLAFIIFSGNNYYQSMFIGSLYLDVNPSIKLDIQRNDKVKDVIALNDDGKIITENVNVKNMNVSDAVISILKSYEDAGYIVSGEDIILLTAQLDERIRDTVIHDILNHYVSINKHPMILSQDVSKDEDILTGKTALVRKIVENEHDIDSSLYRMNLREIVEYSLEHDVDLNKYATIYGDLRIFEKEEIEDDDDDEVIEEIVEEIAPVIQVPVEKPAPAPVHVPTPTQHQDDDDDDDDWDDDDDDDDRYEFDDDDFEPDDDDDDD